MTKVIARVVGARPQFMQVPPLKNALEQAGFTHRLVHTGQHYDEQMSEAFFKDLGLPHPDANLGIGGKSQGAATGQMIEKFESWLKENPVDAVLVDGDTNSTMAAALAAVKLHIPVFHVEAGLRDWDRRRPEEINRVVTDSVSSLNLAPLPRAIENLKLEGRGHTAHLVGDVLLDCFLHYLPMAKTDILDKLGVTSGEFDVMTLHRPDNTNMEEMPRFKEIMAEVASLPRPIIFPVHPRTRAILSSYVDHGGALGNLRLIDPVGYLDMLALVNNCNYVFTDSGGLPREAAWSGKRVVMLFREDSWHDMLDRNWVQIGKTDRASIHHAYKKATPAPSVTREFYGGGQASQRIVSAIQNFFNKDSCG